MGTPLPPLRITRADILAEAAECEATAAASQRLAEDAWERCDNETAMVCERDAVQMQKSARWWRAYADSPDGRPPPEEDAIA